MRHLLFLWMGMAIHGVPALRFDISSTIERRGVALNLTNQADRRYSTVLNLEGRDFTVLVDTGSSDLWVAGSVNGTDTGVRGEVSYAKDSVEGVIKTANLQFGDYSVSDQAFLEIEPSDKHVEGTGILGLGPSMGSFLMPTLSSANGSNLTDGSPMLYRIFEQGPRTPNYFTLLLGRETDPTDNHTGTITIGEVLPEYAAIVLEPKLNISVPLATVEIAALDDSTSMEVNTAETYANQRHLQVLLDENGIIGPDGEAINYTSSVSNSENVNKATVVFDSGFSLPQVPSSIATAIYGRFVGAEVNIVQGAGYIWVLPCTLEVNVTFRFGGKDFPIHPLDATMRPKPLGLQPFENARGEEMCIGTFQPFTFEQDDVPTYDMILGMAFLRNTYTLFDYGDFVQNSTKLADPYIQLLSVTDPAEAHSDFVTSRLGGVEPETKPRLRPVSSEDGDGVTTGNPDDVGGPKVQSAIVASVASVVGVLLVVACFFAWWYRRKRARSRRW